MEKYSLPDIPPLTLAYIAGQVDGEGTISIRRGARSRVRIDATLFEEYSASLSVAQKDRAILEWLRATFGGGSIIQIKAGGFNRENYTPTYYWKVQARQATEAVRAIAPYLRIKKRQADVIAAFAEAKAQYRWRRRPVGYRGGMLPTPPDLLETYRRLCTEIQTLNGRKVINVGPRVPKAARIEHSASSDAFG